MRWVLVVAVLAGLALPCAVEAAKPAPPKTYVEDLAGIIDDKTERKLLGYLQELEQKTTAQFIVLTVPTTSGKPIERYAIDIAQAWGLGQKGKDNGILFVVAVRDRKYRFEVGYGLEGPLPDSFCGTVGRTHLVPNFKRGDYSKGVLDATAAILNKLEQHYNVELSGVPTVKMPRRGMARTGRRTVTPFGACAGAPLILVIALIVIGSRLFRYWMFGYWGGGYYRSHIGGGWGGFGGGSSGGGFGSFGGGGGGGFGGGGASGSW